MEDKGEGKAKYVAVGFYEAWTQSADTREHLFRTREESCKVICGY